MTQESVRPIRVAQVITRLELGGAQEIALALCGRLDPRKYETVLIAGSGGMLDPQALRLAPRTQVHLVPWLKHPIRPFSDLWAVLRLASLLRREKVDLVHTHSSKAGIVGRLAARLAGVKAVVHTVHGWSFHPLQSTQVRWVYKALERFSADLTDRIITVSDENRRSGVASRIGREEQYSVIHCGIEPKEYVRTSNRRAQVRRRMGLGTRPTVLVLSNFKPQKDPGTVVEVLDRLVKSVPKAVLLWAGDGPLRPLVEAEAARRGLASHMELLGWRHDVADLLAASDVLLLASRYEGLPRVVLQAMAASRPVVATAVSGTPEAVTQGRTGFLREAGDAPGLAKDLARLLKNRKLAASFGRAGRKNLTGSFRIGRMVAEIEEVYGAVLGVSGLR